MDIGRVARMNAPLAISLALLLLDFSLLALGAPSLLVGFAACVGAWWAASWLDAESVRERGKR